MSALAPNYKRKNLSFVKGTGSYLVTADGKKYLEHFEEIFHEIAKNDSSGKLEGLLEGPECHNGFKRLN